jgi:hypothetical protein
LYSTLKQGIFTETPLLELLAGRICTFLLILHVQLYRLKAKNSRILPGFLGQFCKVQRHWGHHLGKGTPGRIGSRGPIFQDLTGLGVLLRHFFSPFFHRWDNQPPPNSQFSAASFTCNLNLGCRICMKCESTVWKTSYALEQAVPEPVSTQRNNGSPYHAHHDSRWNGALQAGPFQST